MEVSMLVVSISPQSRASFATKYNLTLLECAQKLTWYFKYLCRTRGGTMDNLDPLLVSVSDAQMTVDFDESTTPCFVFDSSFARDISLLEVAREFVATFKRHERETISRDGASASLRDDATFATSDASSSTPHDPLPLLPVLCSYCPGWICYAEKTLGSSVISHLSSVKSPQQIMGTLVKHHLTPTLPESLRSHPIFHLSIMPCFDKKLEASRADFRNDAGLRDVDCVLSTVELEAMILEDENLKLQLGAQNPLELFQVAISHPPPPQLFILICSFASCARICSNGHLLPPNCLLNFLFNFIIENAFGSLGLFVFQCAYDARNDGTPWNAWIHLWGCFGIHFGVRSTRSVSATTSSHRDHRSTQASIPAQLSRLSRVVHFG